MKFSKIFQSESFTGVYFQFISRLRIEIYLSQKKVSQLLFLHRKVFNRVHRNDYVRPVSIKVIKNIRVIHN